MTGVLLYGAPAPGLVEHDPEEIFRVSLEAMREALQKREEAAFASAAQSLRQALQEAVKAMAPPPASS